MSENKAGPLTAQTAGVWSQLCTGPVESQQNDVLFETGVQQQAAGHESGASGSAVCTWAGMTDLLCTWKCQWPGSSLRLVSGSSGRLLHAQGHWQGTSGWALWLHVLFWSCNLYPSTHGRPWRQCPQKGLSVLQPNPKLSSCTGCLEARPCPSDPQCGFTLPLTEPRLVCPLHLCRSHGRRPLTWAHFLL